MVLSETSSKTDVDWRDERVEGQLSTRRRRESEGKGKESVVEGWIRERTLLADDLVLERVMKDVYQRLESSIEGW